MDNDHLRLYRRHEESELRGPDPHRVELVELDVDTCGLEWTGRITDVTDTWSLRVSPGGRLLVVKDRNGYRLRLHDGRTGEVLATLWESRERRAGGAVFLSDARFLVSRSDGDALALTLYSEDHESIRTLTVTSPADYRFGCEISPGQLVVATYDDDQDEIDWRSTVYIVDTNEGSVREVARDLFPVCRIGSYHYPTVAPTPGSQASRLFFGPEHRSIWRLDHETGDTELVIGRAANTDSPDTKWRRVR